ncbi:MAG: hypothetical protein FWD38_01890 [Oscillospiraceae bacterium]|nr:hypothetical protein [Oscillospiraceae bacterium]
MRFLTIQILIVALVCVFIAAISNLTELGTAGWLIAATTAYALYRIYRQLSYDKKFSERKEKSRYSDLDESEFSSQVRYFLFDDSTNLQDD